MQLMLMVNKYRYIIFTAIVLAVILTLLLMPSLIVEAGKAPSVGG